MLGRQTVSHTSRCLQEAGREVRQDAGHLQGGKLLGLEREERNWTKTGVENSEKKGHSEMKVWTAETSGS